MGLMDEESRDAKRLLMVGCRFLGVGANVKHVSGFSRENC